MLMTFDQAAEKIKAGKLLHIAASETLLRKLPKGNWVGGSTEYFMEAGGGKVSDEVVAASELDFAEYAIKSYDTAGLPSITADAYDNGFSVTIIPFDSEVHQVFAHDAQSYENIFLKNVVGWIAGVNLSKEGQTALAVDGRTGEAFTDRAVVLHVSLPAGKTAVLNIVNIFKPDETTPIITFDTNGFRVKECFAGGEKTDLAAYIEKNGIDTKLPLVGDYFGTGVNVSVKAIENGEVSFFAPVFKGIEYRFAEPIADYAAVFNKRIGELGGVSETFACNCILNFLYGGLEGKDLGGLYGPVTFGEIAVGLLNQTLVYVNII